MIFFLLPQSFLFQYRKIDIHNDIEPTAKEKSSLSFYLSEIKEKVKEINTEWDIYKEYTNPFEYIHTCVPNNKTVAQYKPVSPSYFKMVEIIKHFKLLDSHHNCSLKTFHLAEGAGGFIEAIVHLRQNSVYSRKNEDQYYGMSLLKENDKNSVFLKKNQLFSKENSNIIIEYGRDGTGNLLSVENFVGCVEKVGGKMDIITANGWLDTHVELDNYETRIYPLLLAQICFAICLQKKGGCFILRINDCFTTSTVELLYLLSSFYEKVYLTKPRTSCFTNSEKYLVCINFHFNKNQDGDYYSYLLNCMKHICRKPDVNNPVVSSRIFRFEIPRYFTLKLEEYNMILGQQQIETIFSTIILMDTPNKKSKIEHLIRLHIHKCVQWCHLHGEPVNYF